MITYEWRGPFTNAEVNVLHAEGFGHRPVTGDWRAQVAQHSLGWVCARDGTELAGFVNVAWDGAAHAFILDTLVMTRLAGVPGVEDALVAEGEQAGQPQGERGRPVDPAPAAGDGGGGVLDGGEGPLGAGPVACSLSAWSSCSEKRGEQAH